ncbi:MAG: hypothetical protein PHV32_00440 [Eubacteriales bacterium]|nr:hypothetical protein [Eubacteriales bacterium]
MDNQTIINTIKKQISDILPEGQQFVLDDCIGPEGLCIDSLRYFKLISTLEKKLNHQIEDAQWDYDPNLKINDIINLFIKKF